MAWPRSSGRARQSAYVDRLADAGDLCGCVRQKKPGQDHAHPGVLFFDVKA